MADAAGVDAARRVLHDAVRRRVFPCAVVLVSASSGIIWHEAVGTLSFDDEAPPAAPDTWFDLASLTKPLATTPVVLALAARGAIGLDDPIARFLPSWRAADRQHVTVADLLEHASGLPARFTGPPPSPDAMIEAICQVPLEYAPRTRSVYSDLGFILLGLMAQAVSREPLDALFQREMEPVAALHPDARQAGFGAPANRRARTAPTAPLPEDARGTRLQGEVHDDYAALLRGVAGHAGLFGTAAGVAALAAPVLAARRGQPEFTDGPFSALMVGRAVSGSGVPGSSRGLGWDRMLPTSSCGTRMSPSAVGHVGFTGTSVWIDPDRDRCYVLLTNRACDGGTLDDMRTVRRAFHDALATV